MPTQHSSATEVQLYALLLESIFWGVHIISLCFCLKVLLRTRSQWRRRPEISKVMLAVVLLMACIGTLDTFLTFAQNLKALVYYDGPGGPDAVYNDTSGWMHLLGVCTSLFLGAITSKTLRSSM
jgi:membrane associated rhomboid family serine protease